MGVSARAKVVAGVVGISLASGGLGAVAATQL
jgi:hypothetical protein